MWSKRNFVIAILAAIMLLTVANVSQAATEEEIEAAINAGVDWLVGNQNGDGSWGSYAHVAVTGLSVVKLQDRARELGTSEYDDEIQAGLDYIFSQAEVDAHGPGTGISFDFWEETYQTGIALMAIANDGDPSQIVDVAGSEVNGMIYEAVMQGIVDYFAWAQNDNGGWGYEGPPGSWSDQSNTGYAVLGISYADDAGVSIPDSLGTKLDNWISYIQNTSGGTEDGGSGYGDPANWVNQLKTGNLIFQMTYRGMGPGDAPFDAAIAYIERHWRDNNLDPGWGYDTTPHYQAMYCLMKGLQSSGVDEVDTDGDGQADDDWFNQEPPASPAQDFATAIVANQNGDGSWPSDYWGDHYLATAWALLTLEKVTVVHQVDVALDIKPTSCPNPLNVGIKGVLPVAIVGTGDFDVTQVDLSTVQLMLVDPARADLEDVCTAYLPLVGKCSQYDCTEDGPDGYMDLTLKFDCQVIAEALEAIGGPLIDGEEILVTLTGNLLPEYGGTPIIGEDVVRIIKKGE